MRERGGDGMSSGVGMFEREGGGVGNELRGDKCVRMREGEGAVN